MKDEKGTVGHDLKKAGLRMTPQRLALLSHLRAANSPISVEELVRKGKGAYDTATGYRILDALILAKLVRKISIASDRALFEATGTHHHHAVCTSCGIIVDVEACLPKSLDDRVRVSAGFERIDDHALEFFGLCKRCAKK